MCHVQAYCQVSNVKLAIWLIRCMKAIDILMKKVNISLCKSIRCVLNNILPVGQVIRPNNIQYINMKY